ncbi:hypothetical protein GQ457_08G016170 [Hibiscus cannabinus]
MTSTSAQILTSFGHELRACLRFRLVKTTIRESGFENCPFFKMDEDNERVVDCTTPNFNGIISVMDLSGSWVALEKASSSFDKALITNGLERFEKSETEKLHFLGPALLMFLQTYQAPRGKHMDKVLFFKMGKFYELFEMDAHIGEKELNLQYMKGKKPHCGFPEKNFSMNVEKLALKVCLMVQHLCDIAFVFPLLILVFLRT